MNYIVFSDLDGTLRPKTGSMSKRCTDAIRSFKNRGGEFVMSTGRNRQKTEEFASEYGGSRYIIVANGGEVFDTLKRKTIFAAEIPKPAVRKLWKIAQEVGCSLILNIDADFRYISKHREGDFTSGDYEYVEKVFKDLDEVFEKYRVVGGYFSGMSDELRSVVKTKMFEIKDVIVANEGDNRGENYIDFLSSYANKGIAIKKLLQYLNASYEDTISLGDGLNDVPMFSATKLSVVVENAVPGAKKIADKVINSVDEDGAADFLDSLV